MFLLIPYAMVAVVELARLMSSAYELDRDQILPAIESLLRTTEIAVERAEVVWKALCD